MGKNLLMVGLVVSVSLAVVFVSGCESDAQKGAGLGALAGAGVGAIIGHQTGKTTEGALIGGAVGGGTGYLIGSEQDKKKAAAETQSLREEMNTITVNITNPNGSITSVRLQKQGVGYLGPKGEYYNSLPTQEQLRQAGYGL